MKMKNPPHPGDLVREECIKPLGLTVKEAARALGVTRQALSNVINGKAAISPQMAIRFSKAFGSSPEVWLGHADGLRFGPKEAIGSRSAGLKTIDH
jgi:addiction module HigA family antidote